MNKLTSLNLLLFSFVFAFTFTACQEDNLIEEMSPTENIGNDSPEKKLTKQDARIILEESLKKLLSRIYS